VGPKAVLDAVVKRKIPSPRRESNYTNSGCIMEEKRSRYEQHTEKKGRETHKMKEFRERERNSVIYHPTMRKG
jgi:hypothetical protein